MMDKKRIRQTLNDFVERYLLGDVDGSGMIHYGVADGRFVKFF